jgi:hypothetical protein
MGVMIEISAVAKAIPIPSPSKKLCRKEDKIFRYPAIPLPFKFFKQFLFYYAFFYIMYSDKRD